MGGRCCVVRRGTASGRSLAACGGTPNVHTALDDDPRPATHPPRPSSELCAAPPGPSVLHELGWPASAVSQKPTPLAAGPFKSFHMMLVPSGLPTPAPVGFWLHVPGGTVAA